jgi:hypothetical protein
MNTCDAVMNAYNAVIVETKKKWAYLMSYLYCITPHGKNFQAPCKFKAVEP